MKIITYSQTTAATLKDDIGKADYSYYFIYKKYLPLLHQIGEVIEIRNPSTEVDAIYASSGNVPCVFLSFTPPHGTATELKCPTVCVFAWEFDTIPNEVIDEIIESNWAHMLEKIGHALTISNFGAKAALRDVPQLNIGVVPSPIKTSMDKVLADVSADRFQFCIDGSVYDSDCYSAEEGVFITKDAHPAWDQEKTSFEFSDKNPNTAAMLAGFFPVESWGAWCASETPRVLLPFSIDEGVVVELVLVGYGHNIDKAIGVNLGTQRLELTIEAGLQKYQLVFAECKHATKIVFDSIDLTIPPGTHETRMIGLGVKHITISQMPKTRFKTALHRIKKLPQKFSIDRKPEPIELELEGVIYTSIFNPSDGRKNWQDMLTAFCWAFKDEPNATLLLKMTSWQASNFLGLLGHLIAALQPFRCRVVIVHGFLDDLQFAQMQKGTHFIVNTSYCEGQCLPLMEFMAEGIPAVAPTHTAMSDYIEDANAFSFDTHLKTTIWPNDSRIAIRALHYQPNWESLVDAFQRSYEVFIEQPEAYQEMRRASIRSVYESASPEVLAPRLKSFLKEVAETPLVAT